MTDGRSWRGHGRFAFTSGSASMVYDSLTAFAEARPTASLVALAEALGEEDVNAVQVFSGLVAEAERRHQLTRLTRGQFVREFLEGLPNGWPPVLDDANRFRVAKTLSAWIAFTPETHQERARQISAVLLATPPPPGWRPLGPDDELLRTLLPDEEA